MAARLSFVVFACLLAASLAAPSALSDDASSTAGTPSAAPGTPTAAPATTETPVDPACLSACPSKLPALVPDRCNCQNYFQCAKSGAVVPLRCLPWQNFDAATASCRFWADVRCAQTSTLAPTLPPTTPQPVVPGCDFVPQCPASGAAKLAVPCKDSCGIYVQCDNGSWTKKSCGWLSWFDVKSLTCKTFGATCA